MHTGKNYKISEFLFWTKNDILILFFLSFIPTALYYFLHWTWLAIPWVPVALVGTAAAFVVGFKNTQTYNRLWEARQIWGSIINTSRSFGLTSRDFINDSDSVHRQIIYRHCAWLTALRFQLREQREWESHHLAAFREYRKRYSVPEWENKLEDELQAYLSQEDLQYVLRKKNRATQLISLQSRQLKKLKTEGKIDPLDYVELENLLVNLYDQQGKCERIKNFPYPRQFSSINLFFIWLLVILLPLGMLNEFQKAGPNCVWFTIPFSMLVSWVFTSMERVGEATANPFEGGANDVPMAALSRTIEIDLREMLDEQELPPPVTAVNHILM